MGQQYSVNGHVYEQGADGKYHLVGGASQPMSFQTKAPDPTRPDAIRRTRNEANASDVSPAQARANLVSTNLHNRALTMEVDDKEAARKIVPSSGAHGEAALKGIEPGLANVVRGVSDGRIQLPAFALKTPYWQNVLQHVTNYDPSFDASNYNARAQARKDFAPGGSQGKRITALETALHHGVRMQDAISKLGNADGYLGTLLYNPIKNLLEDARSDPDISEFRDIRHKYSAEGAKTLLQSGAGTGQERGEGERELGLNLGGTAQRRVLSTDAHLYKDAIDSITGALRSQLGPNARIQDFLHPDALDAYQRLTAPGGVLNKDLGGANNPLPTPGASRGSAPPPLPGVNGGPRGGPGGPGRGGPTTPPGAPEQNVATGDYRNVLDPVTNKALNQFLAQRKDPAYINAFLQAHGADQVPEKAIHDLYDWADHHPEYNGPLGQATKSVPLTGWQKVSSSPFAAGVSGVAKGVTFGGLDEAAGGVSALFGGDYTKTRDQVDANSRALAAAHPVANFVGDLAGTTASALLPELRLAKLGLTGKSAVAARIALDGGLGAVRGGLEDNDNRLGGAAKGAAEFAGGGMLGRAAARPLTALATSRPVTSGVNVVRGMFGRDPIVRPTQIGSADASILSAASKAGVENITGPLDRAAGLGVPMSLADTTPELTSLAGAAVRRSPTAANIAEQSLLPRARGQVDRLNSAINRDLGPTENIPQLSEDLSTQASTAAGPLYKEAFQGGSVAPLEQQFGNAFAQSSGEVTAARRALADAQRQMTLASAETSRAGNNVYGASGASRSTQEAKAAVEAAQKRVTDAEAAHGGNLGRLRQAQADGSANAPGAVWSPRIQQFLDDPIMKDGLQRGLAVQRIEAVAKGEPFNPREYAVTGADGAGQHVVGSVPNMRLLDAGKRGLDSIIAENTDPVTGKITEYGRSVTQFKRAYLDHLDEINPTYGAARAAYGGPMQSREALQFGQDAHTMDPNTLRVALNRRSPEQLGQSQLGFQDALNQQGQKLRYSGNPWAALDTPQMEQRLGTMYPGNPGVPNLLRQRDMEMGLARSTNDILGNSKTAQRGIADQSFQGENMPQMMLDVGLNLATGQVPIGVVAKNGGSQWAKSAWNSTLGKRSVQRADAMAPNLFNTDPRASTEWLQSIIDRQNAYRGGVDVMRGRIGAGASPLGAALLGQIGN